MHLFLNSFLENNRLSITILESEVWNLTVLAIISFDKKIETIKSRLHNFSDLSLLFYVDCDKMLLINKYIYSCHFSNILLKLCFNKYSYMSLFTYTFKLYINKYSYLCHYSHA